MLMKTAVEWGRLREMLIFVTIVANSGASFAALGQGQGQASSKNEYSFNCNTKYNKCHDFKCCMNGSSQITLTAPSVTQFIPFNSIHSIHSL